MGLGLGLADPFGALESMSDDAVVGLLRRRPDLAAPPVPRTWDGLAARADTWESVDACLAGLTAPAHLVLQTLCLLPDGSSVEAVAALLGPVPVDDVRRVVDDLRALRVVGGPDEALRPAAMVRRGMSYPAALGRPAVDLLVARSKEELKDAAEALDVPYNQAKHTLVAGLARRLADPGVVKALVASAPEGVRALLARLDQHPVCALPMDYRWSQSKVVRSTPAVWLATRGLLVATQWATAEMPREVGLALRGGVAYPSASLSLPALASRPVPSDRAHARRAGVAAAETALGAVAALLRALGDTPATVLKAGGVGARELKRLTRVVDLPVIDVARLLELADAAGLVDEDDDAGWVAPTAAFDAWEASGPAEQWLALVDGWRSSTREFALAGRDDYDGKTIPALAPAGDRRAAVRRRSLLDAVAALPPGAAAADSAALAAAAVWWAPLAWPGDPEDQTCLGGWIAEELEVLGLCGHGALTPLGRAVLAGDRSAALAEVSSLLATRGVTFTIQADLTAVAPADLAADVRAELALMATVESSGGATVWRFSEASVARALDAGRSAGEVTAFLERHAAKGVPSALRYLVDDTARRHGSLRVGAVASYVRSDDPALVAQVLRVRRAAGLGLRQLAPTVVVSSAPAAELIAALRAAGLLAVGEGGDGAVLVSRPPAHRAPTTPDPRTALLGEDDLRRIVAELRSSPAPVRPPEVRGPQHRARPPGVDLLERLVSVHDDDEDDEDQDLEAVEGSRLDAMMSLFLAAQSAGGRRAGARRRR